MRKEVAVGWIIHPVTKLQRVQVPRLIQTANNRVNRKRKAGSMLRTFLTTTMTTTVQTTLRKGNWFLSVIKMTSLKCYLHFSIRGLFFFKLFTDYGEEKKKKGTEETSKVAKEESTKSQEEKRKHIKSLIDKIPTDKNALFGYQLDWAVIDNVSLYLYT